MVRKMLKGNKGIIVADALVSILLMMIFIGIISTLCYNIYISASYTKRNSTATNYGIKIMEYIEKTAYDDVTYSNLVDYINTLEGASVNSDSPYKINVEILKYNETEGNTDKLDLIKTINLEITYNVGDSEKTVEFEKVKQR